MRPDCACSAWNPPTTPPRVTGLSDPSSDRDLYLAWRAAMDAAVLGRDPDAGYAIMMVAIEHWQRRVLGLPPAPVPPAFPSS